MSDNHIPSGEWKGPTVATEKSILTFEEELKAFYKKFPNCPPFEVHIEEPCREKPIADFEALEITLVSEAGKVRRNIAFVLFKLATWIGNIRWQED